MMKNACVHYTYNYKCGVFSDACNHGKENANKVGVARKITFKKPVTIHIRLTMHPFQTISGQKYIS